jgi:hypothetical protein
MPSTTYRYGDYTKSVRKIERGKNRKTSIPCAHFIEHVEGIVDGSVYAKNREHGGSAGELERWLDEVQRGFQWKKKGYRFEGDGGEKRRPFSAAVAPARWGKT